MNKLFVGLVALAASGAPNAAPTRSYGKQGVNLSNSHAYKSGVHKVTASGFTAADAPPALFGKNAGGDEVGLGLVNDPSSDTEIYYGMGYVQLDVSGLFGLVSSIAFSTNSRQTASIGASSAVMSKARTPGCIPVRDKRKFRNAA